MSAWEEERKRESKEKNIVFDLMIVYLLCRLTHHEGCTKKGVCQTQFAFVLVTPSD